MAVDFAEMRPQENSSASLQSKVFCQNMATHAQALLIGQDGDNCGEQTEVTD